MKALIFIEVDVVVRHFLHSGAFDDLGKHHPLTFVFPEIGNKRMGDVDPATLHLPGKVKHLPVHEERRRLWKRLFQVSLFKPRFSAQAFAIRRLYSSALGWKASLLYALLGFPGIFHWFDRMTRRWIKRIPYTALEALIDQEKPAVIIHPCVLEGLYLNDLIDSCQRRCIPLIVIMNSWDNPSTKRAMVGNPDWLLVWGEQTQRHAVEFAQMPLDRTIKFGAAQFDVYRAPPRIGRETFCQVNGLDPALPILLYAGSSKGTDEIAHLTALDLAIESGQLGPVTILYRPHPWGGGGRNGHLLLDAVWRNVRIESSMKDYLEKVCGGFTGKYLPDYRDTHDVLSCVDAVISPLSTIILEAALHGKPVMCFLPLGDTSTHFRRDSALIHFHQMFDVPEILVAKGEQSLIVQTQLLLQKVGEREGGARLRKAMYFFVEPFDHPYPVRLRAFVEQVVASPSASRG